MQWFDSSSLFLHVGRSGNVGVTAKPRAAHLRVARDDRESEGEASSPLPPSYQRQYCQGAPRVHSDYSLFAVIYWTWCYSRAYATLSWPPTPLLLAPGIVASGSMGPVLEILIGVTVVTLTVTLLLLNFVTLTFSQLWFTYYYRSVRVKFASIGKSFRLCKPSNGAVIEFISPHFMGCT